VTGASLLLLALTGCGPSAPEPEIEAAKTPAQPAPPQVRRVVAVIGNGDAVPVTLQFKGVGPLYQNYFSTPEFVGDLGAALGACQADEAVVLVTYDSENWIGTITLQTTPEALACGAVSSADGIDLSPMQPVGVALAAYRDRVSSSFDIRVASFKSGVTLLKNTNLCTFWIGGQYPPDGTTWNFCPSYAGNKTCAKGVKDEGVTLLEFESAEHKQYADVCFGY